MLNIALGKLSILFLLLESSLNPGQFISARNVQLHIDFYWIHVMDVKKGRDH